jgi:anti-sigma factor RsiW
MNFDPSSDPRAEMEMRLTAFLLGELNDAEAAQLRDVLANNPELARLHDELQRAIGLVRDTAHDVTEACGTEIAPLLLTDERRQRLLAHFKTVRMPQLKTELVDAVPRRRVLGRVVFYAAAAACVLMMASLFLPALSKAKSKALVVKQAMIEKQRELEARLAEAQPTATPSPVESEAMSVNRVLTAVPTTKEHPPRLAYIALPTLDNDVQQTPALAVGDALGRRAVGTERSGFHQCWKGRLRQRADGFQPPLGCQLRWARWRRRARG